MSTQGENSNRDKTARWLAVSGTALSILLAAALSHWSSTDLLETHELIHLQRMFDEVTTEYYVVSEGAWLDVVDRGFPRKGDAGEEKSERQIDFETKAYARYRLLRSTLESRCSEHDDMRRQLSELECANYRVYILYDATEDGTSTVEAEAKKDPERLAKMKSCHEIKPLLSTHTSRDGRDLGALKRQFTKEHRGLLDAMTATRKLLSKACD